MGALSDSLRLSGIRDDFMKKLGETIPTGLSALFILFKIVTEGKVLAVYKPRVLKTSLSNRS